MCSYDLYRVESTFSSVLIPAALQLRDRLSGVQGYLPSEVKSDGSRVTSIDRDVEQSLGQALATQLSDIELTIVGEEGTVINNGIGTRTIFFDPTDGTALVRLLAPGSTVGACLYDSVTRRFEAAAVADPWMGRLMFTQGGHTYQQMFHIYTGVPLGMPRACRVSAKSFADGGEPLIEVAHGMVRNVFGSNDTRSVLSTEEVTTLWNTLQEKLSTKVRMCSSNLMHQLLVASGGDAIATIMTAIGGPWDMSGVELVRGAGGSVSYLRVDPSGIVVTDDPMQADMVICANNWQTMEQVLQIVTALRS